MSNRPLSQRERVRDRPRQRWMRGLASVVVLSVAQVLRQPGAATWNTIWAEDGRIYANEAVASGWSSLLDGYAGYVQLLPRVLALPLPVMPMTWWAAWLAVASAIVTSLLALFVFHASREHLSSRMLRSTLLVASALAPSMSYEVNANVANLGWPLLFASFWALLSSQPSRVDRALRAVVLAVTALTSTLAVLYLPLAACLFVRRRRLRSEWPVFGAFGAALTAQLILDLSAEPGPSGTSSMSHLPELFAVRVLGSVAFGERWNELGWLHLGSALALFLAAATGACVAIVVGRFRSRVGWVPWLAASQGAVLFAVPVWLRGSQVMELGSGYNQAGSRYVVVPALLIVSAALILVDRLDHRGLRALAAAQVVVTVCSSLGIENPRSAGPTWSSELVAARARCSDGATAVSIPTTPLSATWYVHVSCERLGEPSDPSELSND